MPDSVLTPTQDFIQTKSGYLQSQVGNPDGADKPNKKVRLPSCYRGSARG